MPEFNAPLRDMRFVLHEVFEAPALWARLPALADHVDADTADGFAPRPEYRPLTKFEQRGLRLGHGVWDLVFIKR